MTHVRTQIRTKVWDQVRTQVGAHVRAQVWDQVWAQVGNHVGAQVGDQVWDQVWEGTNNQYGGAFWANWSAYVTYFRDVCGWENSILEKFEIDEALAKSCGWIWWHQNVLAISDRPSVLNRDVRGRLHCANGPSISYRDGWALFHWHGVSVPREIIESPESITSASIIDEKNAEVRRAMIEIKGIEWFVRESECVVLHEDIDPLGHPRRLLQKSFSDDSPLTLVQVKNSTQEPDGTFKDYFLSVHHELRPLLGDGALGKSQKMTCLNAVASTFGMRGEEYRVAAES